ncbi:MAG: twin-arginine translocation signal domain-containing protein [Planctomycetota bacterium]
MRTVDGFAGCRGCPLSRRSFLAAGGAACAGLVTASLPAFSQQDAEKMRIRVVYALTAEKQPGPDWPNVGFDFGPVMACMDRALAAGCPELELVSSMAAGPEPAQAILAADESAGIDGYVVVQMNCWNQVVQTLATAGKPVLYADFPYAGSGGFLVYTARFRRDGAPNVGFVASSRIEDLVEAAKCFSLVAKGGSPADFVAATARLRVQSTPEPGDLAGAEDALATLSVADWRERMRASKILAVGGGWPGIAPAIHSGLDIEVVDVPYAELNAAWEAADPDETRAVADRWQKTAAKIEGVSRATLEASAAMYLAEKQVLAVRGANAIAINCLGGFYGGHIHAYPCLGFHELNNQGLVGACECDLRSTATMVAITALTQGRPGMISDPVIDTAGRQIVYAHCVAPNRAFGPAGPANPFEILTHSEDRQGASVRSLLPLGYLTTTLELAPERQEILFHQGLAVANVPEDRACRTKLAVEPVGDLEKLFTEWDAWGWHRVTFYGDLKEPVFALADELGWKVLEEA